MATTNGTVRLAAMSDIHVSKTGQGALSSMFAQVSERADMSWRTSWRPTARGSRDAA